MAKVGFYLRGARGKLAGATFYGSKVGTVAREIVTPTNAKTAGQMKQRAIFANCVKFYKHAQQALFKFAFEGKRKAESDYNAFVRLNVKRSALFDKELVDNPMYPALGHNWILSQGSLAQANVVANVNSFEVRGESFTSDIQTVGQLSQALINDYGLQDGDYVTMVLVTAPGMTSAASSPSRPAQWNIKQWRIDSNSIDPLYHGDIFSDGHCYNGYFDPISITYPFAAGYAWIFSRVVAGQPLKTSNSELVNNAVAESIVTGTVPEPSVRRALSSWGAKDAAILQGSVAINKTLSPVPEPVVTDIDGDEAPLEGVAFNPGEDKEFELLFNFPYTAEQDDFSTSSENVTVALVGDNTINVTVQEDATPGAAFNVMFRDQIIISGEVASEPVVVSVNNDSELPYSGMLSQSSPATLTLGFDHQYSAVVSDFRAHIYGEPSDTTKVSFAVSNNVLTVTQNGNIMGRLDIFFRDQNFAYVQFAN